MRRILAAIGIMVAGLVLTAGTAAAHVSIQPDEAPQGGYATVSLQVPNEEADASTTQVLVTMPEDHPLASVSVEPVPGWTVTAQKEPLAKPLKTDDGEITEAVTRITYSGGQIAPGQFQRFPISIGPLPTDTDQLVFKAVQTYSDGTEVRWIEEAAPGADEPEHPAPSLTLVKASGDHHGATAADTSSDTSTQGDSSSDSLGIIGILLGATGVVLAIIALVLHRTHRE